MPDTAKIKNIILQTISSTSSIDDKTRSDLVSLIESFDDEQLTVLYHDLMSGGKDVIAFLNMIKAKRKQEDEVILDLTKKLATEGVDNSTIHQAVDTLVQGFSQNKFALKSKS